jgi:hypothetical protein
MLQVKNTLKGLAQEHHQGQKKRGVGTLTRAKKRNERMLQTEMQSSRKGFAFLFQSIQAG